MRASFKYYLHSCWSTLATDSTWCVLWAFAVLLFQDLYLLLFHHWMWFFLFQLWPLRQYYRTIAGNDFHVGLTKEGCGLATPSFISSLSLTILSWHPVALPPSYFYHMCSHTYIYNCSHGFRSLVLPLKKNIFKWTIWNHINVPVLVYKSNIQTMRFFLHIICVLVLCLCCL